MKVYAAILIAATLSWSCTQKNQENEHHHDGHNPQATAQSKGPVADLEQQIMAVHDSVMPRMSDLLRLKKEVAAKVDKAREGAVKKEGTAIRSRLEQADEAMMEWMHQYNGDTLGKLDQAKAVEYLKDQQVKVNEVRDQTEKSISEAKRFLQ